MSTVATTRILHLPANTNISGPDSSWVWPLPRLDGIDPCILTCTADPRGQVIVIGYRGRSLSPSLIPVFAAQDGVVTYAGTDTDGPTLCIDHAGGWSTQYSALTYLLARPTDRFRRRRKERVRSGDVIGHTGRTALRIRFTLFQFTDEESVAVNPKLWMPGWSSFPWFELAIPSPRRRHLST